MSHEALPAQGPVDVNVSRNCTCHPDDNPPTPCEHRYAFRDCTNAAEERYMRETLAMLQKSYAKAAKPYIDRLVAIQSMRQPNPVVMSIERLHDLWEMKLDQGVTANVQGDRRCAASSRSVQRAKRTGSTAGLGIALEGPFDGR